MSNVVFKKGLFNNLPVSAETNELLFATDVGKLFQGTGAEGKLIEYTDLVTGYDNLEALKLANIAINNKLYITNDGKLYLCKDDLYIPLNEDANSHSHDNVDILNKLTQDAQGNLSYNGMVSHNHANKDVINKLTQDAQGNLLYDGVKIGGNTIIEGGTGSGNCDCNGNVLGGGVEQKVLLNVVNGEKYNIVSEYDMSEGKAIVQAYKFIAGEQDVINTIKEFNNGEEANFYYDKDNLVFNEGCSIRTEWNLQVTEQNGLYETEVINKAKFKEIHIS